MCQGRIQKLDSGVVLASSKGKLSANSKKVFKYQNGDNFLFGISKVFKFFTAYLTFITYGLSASELDLGRRSARAQGPEKRLFDIKIKTFLLRVRLARWRDCEAHL